MNAASLAFAESEVQRTKTRAVRALNHLQVMCELDIRPAANLARFHVEQSTGAYRAAIGKRAFELRQLQTS